jgi:hypothetical protein
VRATPQAFASLLAALLPTGCYAGSSSTPEDAATPVKDTGPEADVAADSDVEAGVDATADVDAGPVYIVCPDGMDASFGSIYNKMLSTAVASCGALGFGCHSTFASKQTGSLLDFSLDASAVYAELLGPDGGGAPSTNIAGDAGGTVLRVVPGDADASMLYIKLTLTTGDPRYGAGMPLYTPGSVCPAALDAVRAWIDKGASR